MNAKVESTSSKIDIVIWLAVVAIVLGGVYANTYYGSVGVFYRALAGIAITAIAGFVAFQSTQGKAVWNLARESRVEIRKVVWPTRQETTQTTLIVVLVVFVVALILWGLDSLLSWGVSAVIG